MRFEVKFTATGAYTFISHAINKIKILQLESMDQNCMEN